MAKMISIAESDLKALQAEVNNLRELVSQFVGNATKLLPANGVVKKRATPSRRGIKGFSELKTKQEKLDFIKLKLK